MIIILALTPLISEAGTPKKLVAPESIYPYAIKIPSRPGFVLSPYRQGGMIDVRGRARGAEIKDPFTGFKKIFLVP